MKKFIIAGIVAELYGTISHFQLISDSKIQVSVVNIFT